MDTSVKVALSSDFLTAFAKLPRTIQGKVTEFINKFKNNPTSTGINYEKIENAIDKKIYSVRIDDTYRGIVVREQGTGVYLLLWVDHHDEAYAWAMRKRCEVNPKTGAVQIFDAQVVKPESPSLFGGSLFGDINDEKLLALGVPNEQLNYVKSFSDKESFYKAGGTIPSDAYEYLQWLVEGIPVDEVLEFAKDEQEATKKATSLAAALELPLTLKSFVVVEGEEELRRIMAEPLEKWRVFLHPTQRKIVNRNYAGPARVLGGAGTGKTVVAMHRAKFLASKLTGNEKILFTTFTANLAADIRENLKKICTVTELRRIDVIHLDAWVNNFFKEASFTAQIEYDKINDFWEQAILLAGVDLPFEAGFYDEEWNRVVLAQEALSLEKYVILHL